MELGPGHALNLAVVVVGVKSLRHTSSFPDACADGPLHRIWLNWWLGRVKPPQGTVDRRHHAVHDDQCDATEHESRRVT